MLDREILDKEILDKEILDKEILDKEILDKEILDKCYDMQSMLAYNSHKSHARLRILILRL